ncbi:MAG: TetR/AcrR family transcriptional regulator [Lachnospiraceae bacterium]
METKKEDFVSIMKEKIIRESIKSLQQEGLKFSVDTLANKLKISKKTIYKYFPDKEALALALYQKYYTDAMNQAEKLIVNSEASSIYSNLLHLYFDSKMMIRSEIFNKYKLNNTIYSYTAKQNDLLWMTISSSFTLNGTISEKDKEVIRLIIDSSFEQLCNARMNPDDVIERLVKLL